MTVVESDKVNGLHEIVNVACLPYSGSANPYQDLLSGSLEKQGVNVTNFSDGVRDLFSIAFGKKVLDSVHLHWPDPYIFGDSYFKSLLKSVVSCFLFLVIRIRGIRLVWTLHNLRNHESKYPFAEKLFLTWYLRLVDVVIAHCEKAKQMLAESEGQFLLDKTLVVPHGNYCDSYEKIQKNEACAIAKFDPHKKTILFLGHIRPYKGLLELIQSFRLIPGDDICLVIAGRAKTEADELTIRAAAEKDPRVDLRIGFVPDNKVGAYLSAADLYVAPFTSVLTSGSVILAMSFGLPCVVPRIGCLPELLSQQDELIYEPKQSGALTERLKFCVSDSERLSEIGRINREVCEQELCWDGIASSIKQLYLDLKIRKKPNA